MADVQSDTIKSLLEAAVEVARLAGQLFTAGFRDRETLIRGIQTKSSAADLVTATDKAVETFIFEELRKRFATHKFVGEEGIAGPTQWPEDDTPVWIVDPVDGTLNFAHGLEPFTCISIACAIGKRPVVGVVYAPLVDQLFSAGRGLGAFLNSSPLPTFAHFPPLALASALVVTEFGHAHEPEIQAPKQKAISKLIGNCRGIRCFGSAAMNMCYVAKGSCDAYYEAGIHSWDVSAACVILEEAGGKVVNYVGGDSGLDICARNVLCVRTGKIAEQDSLIADLRSVLEASGATVDGQYERD